jgi:hypothetical protein
MDSQRLESMNKRVARFREQSDRILDGDENYDGADGARYVSELCDIAEELISELKATVK